LGPQDVTGRDWGAHIVCRLAGGSEWIGVGWRGSRAWDVDRS
jgi:hypothetical protein